MIFYQKPSRSVAKCQHAFSACATTAFSWLVDMSCTMGISPKWRPGKVRRSSQHSLSIWMPSLATASTSLPSTNISQNVTVTSWSRFMQHLVSRSAWTSQACRVKKNKQHTAVTSRTERTTSSVSITCVTTWSSIKKTAFNVHSVMPSSMKSTRFSSMKRGLRSSSQDRPKNRQRSIRKPMRSRKSWRQMKTTRSTSRRRVFCWRSKESTVLKNTSVLITCLVSNTSRSTIT